MTTPFREEEVRSAVHYLLRGHRPEVAYLDTERICLICDVGTPTTQPMSPANTLPLMFSGVRGAGTSS